MFYFNGHWLSYILFPQNVSALWVCYLFYFLFAFTKRPHVCQHVSVVTFCRASNFVWLLWNVSAISTIQVHISTMVSCLEYCGIVYYDVYCISATLTVVALFLYCMAISVAWNSHKTRNIHSVTSTNWMCVESSWKFFIFSTYSVVDSCFLRCASFQRKCGNFCRLPEYMTTAYTLILKQKITMARILMVNSILAFVESTFCAPSFPLYLHTH